MAASNNRDHTSC